jgi:hypothetical protein
MEHGVKRDERDEKSGETGIFRKQRATGRNQRTVAFA